MKKVSNFTVFFLVMLILMIVISACTSPTASNPGSPAASPKGRHVGYSWQGEADGVKLSDASQYIETILELDKDGVITDAKMRFFIKKDGFWLTRQSGNAYVAVDFAAQPTAATPGNDYKAGKSMFTIDTADMMSFYAVAVDANGVVAVGMVDPITRYLLETKLPAGFDYDTPFGDLTIGSGMLVPTIRTSGSGMVKPSDWDSLADKTILDINVYSNVVNKVGVLQGINNSSSVKEFLEALGVEFAANEPQPLQQYGYFGLGGWVGNYSAIEADLIGKNAKEVTSLVDWSNSRYAGAVNDKNQFGIDVATGATKTVQNSIDGISGATVRISRESTSYQRALVSAGILEESEVIIGRF